MRCSPLLRDRRGFTLIEVIVALGLLMVAVLALASATGSFVGNLARNDAATRGVELADNRISEIQLDPQYDSLTARYQGTEVDPDSYTGFSRTTKVVVSSSPPYSTITVTVAGPGITGVVQRTTTVGAP